MDVFDTRRWPVIDWRNYAPADARLAPWLTEVRPGAAGLRQGRLRSAWRIPTSVTSAAAERPDSKHGFDAESFLASRIAHPGMPSAPAGTGSRRSGVGQLVYCIVEAQEDPKLDVARLDTGDAERHVYEIRDGDLAALVSDAPSRLRIADPAASSAHRRVTEAVARTHTVLPLSYGSMVSDSEEVVQLLRSARELLADILRSIRGKVEVRLRLLWDQERVAATLRTDQTARICALRAEIAASPQGKTYLARMRLGQVVAEALQARADQLLLEVQQALAPVTVATRPTLPADDDAIMDAALLVDRERMPELHQVLEGLELHHAGMLSFDCSGPRAPVSFVNIKLALDQVG